MMRRLLACPSPVSLGHAAPTATHSSADRLTPWGLVCSLCCHVSTEPFCITKSFRRLPRGFIPTFFISTELWWLALGHRVCSSWSLCTNPGCRRFESPIVRDPKLLQVGRVWQLCRRRCHLDTCGSLPRSHSAPSWLPAAYSGTFSTFSKTTKCNGNAKCCNLKN